METFLPVSRIFDSSDSPSLILGKIEVIKYKPLIFAASGGCWTNSMKSSTNRQVGIRFKLNSSIPSHPWVAPSPGTLIPKTTYKEQVHHICDIN